MTRAPRKDRPQGPFSGHWADDAALLALALLVRLAYALSIRHGVLFNDPQIDARLFWDEAVAISRGAAPAGVLFKPPLLSYFLALAHQTLAPSPGAARVLLLVLSAFAAPLAAAVARPALGRRGGLLAGIFTALYAPAVFYGGELLPATLLLLANLVMLVFLLRAEETGRSLLFGAAGLALGISALGSPTVLLFVPLLLIRYRRVLRGAAALLVGACIGIAPATVHNAAAGDFVLVSSNGGINFYFGNHGGADGRSASAPELPAEPAAAERAAKAIAVRDAGRALAPSAVSGYWLRRGLSWIASHPGEAAGLTLKKLWYTCTDAEITDNIDMRAVEQESPVLRFVPFRFGLIFALALPGLFVLGRSRAGRLLLLYALATVLPLLLFFVVGRFRLPLLPTLAAAAAAGVILLRDKLREAARAGRLTRSALAPALLILAGLALSHAPLLGAREDRTWHYHFLKGYVLSSRGDARRATVEFEESLRRNPNAPATMNALAYLYAEQGERLDRAETLARTAVERDPLQRAHALDTLGWVLLKRRNLEGAAAALSEAVRLFPAGEERFKADALEHLAAVREAQADSGEAGSLRAQAARLRAGR